MGAISNYLKEELRDPEYSEGYAESFLNSYIATQIKVIREQRKWKQSDLAREVGTTQTAISRIENVNYSSWNIRTLKKLARAFHLRLKVSFETYGTLPDEVENFSQTGMQRAKREEDPELLDRIGPQSSEESAAEQAIAKAMGARDPAPYSQSDSKILFWPPPPQGVRAEEEKKGVAYAN
jgi:transcriptional regulator with XRE-family HTH domain